MKSLERESARLRRFVADLSLEKHVLADVASRSEGYRQQNIYPERRRQAVNAIQKKYGFSKRHACRIVGQHWGT